MVSYGGTALTLAFLVRVSQHHLLSSEILAYHINWWGHNPVPIPEAKPEIEIFSILWDPFDALVSQ